MVMFYLRDTHTICPSKRRVDIAPGEIAAKEELSKENMIRIVLKSGYPYDVMARFIGNTNEIIPLTEKEVDDLILVCSPGGKMVS